MILSISLCSYTVSSHYQMENKASQLDFLLIVLLFFLYLPVLPKVTVSVVPSSSRSSPLTLACEINGFYPQSMYVLWIRNGNVLPETPQIKQNNDGTYRIRHFLTLSLEERERAGQVQCVAQQPHVAQPAASSIEPSAGDSLGNFNKYTGCQVIFI